MSGISLNLTFDGKEKNFNLEYPKVRHLKDIASKVRGNESDNLMAAGYMLEVLSGGKITVDMFLDSDARNLEVVNKTLEPFLSIG